MLTYSRKLYVLFGILAVILIIASGCSTGQKENSETSQGEGREIKHELGTAHVKGTPKRVVVLELSFLDAVTKLGVKPVGIADDKKKNMIEKLVGGPIEYTSVGTRSEPNLEIISSLQPDLIIADAERHKNVYRDLKEIAPTVVLKSREATYQETIDGFQTIAKALNKEKVGKQGLAEHQKQMDGLKSKLPKNEKRTILLGVARTDSFNIHTSSSYDGEIMEELGFKHAVQSKEAYKDVSLEQLSEINPDFLFISSNEGHTIVDDWKNNPIWKNLKSVKNGQVYEADRDLWTRFRGISSSEKLSKDLIQKVYGK